MRWAVQDVQNLRGTDDGVLPDVDVHGDDSIGPSFGETASAAGVDSRGASPVAKPLFSVRKAGIAAAAVLALGLGSYYGHYWWTAGRYLVTTDDAYVGARSATLSPKVAGYVADIAFSDNDHVKAGDVLIRVDDGDYNLAVQTARDQIAVQEATVARLGKQVVAQQAAVEQANAQLASARAGQTRTDLELKRQQDLSNRQINSRQQLEQAQANYDQAVALVQASQASVESAAANVDVFKAQQEEAGRSLKQLQTALAKAERDLSFTIVKAPVDGVVGNKAVEVGQLVQPGARLAAIVPLDQVYVDANYKETQLNRLRPGQAVDILVDAYPGHVFTGTVESVSPASGSMFSLLPPDNATGNFTKIVQRVPVRIRLSQEAEHEGLLRPGMSVVSSVNIRGEGAATRTAGPAGPASTTR
jgi:membrane fusion protein (multidrug efflux system)